MNPYDLNDVGAARRLRRGQRKLKRRSRRAERILFKIWCREQKRRNKDL